MIYYSIYTYALNFNFAFRVCSDIGYIISSDIGYIIRTLSFRHYCDIIKAVLSIKIEGIA